MNAQKTIKNTIVKVAVACVLAAGLLGTGTACETSGSHAFPGSRNYQTNPAGDDIMELLGNILSSTSTRTTTSSRHYY